MTSHAGTNHGDTRHLGARPSLFGAVLQLVVGILALFFSGCSSDEVTPQKWGEGIYVPEQWQQTRDVLGHRVHVLEEKVPCASCHDLSKGEVGQVRPEGCASCHEKESKLEHASAEAQEKYGSGVMADCLSCHAFTQGPDVAPAAQDHPFAPEDCLRCHEKAQGTVAAIEIHRPGDCLACHAPHEQEGPKSAPCASCHEDVNTFHPAERKDPVKRCTTCHSSQHAPAAEARQACEACHAATEPLIPSTAVFADGHAECISCHKPHDGGDSKAVDCRSCHEEMHVLGSGLARPHRDCENCHNPHDVKAASASGCAKCHTDVDPDHPKHGAAGTCTGCHDPHPVTATFAKVRPCSTCHASAGSETAFHGETSCRECHAPHQFQLGNMGTSLCSHCHQENVAQVDGHGGHKDCGSCHGGLPHHPERLNKACGSCHGKEQGLVTTGHQSCTSCHDAHDGESIVACKTCHAEEHRLAPNGHTECTNCHEPHSSKSNGARCADCHSDEANTPHGRITSDCASCHQPHGPKAVNFAPNCSSCHEKTRLPGLHQLGKHQDCLNCHTPHGTLNRPERSACLSCHQDQVEHHPSAPSCASCHLFVPAH